MPCLSSRIPYGTPVTVEALSRIGEAEAYLRSLGLRQLRVRHHVLNRPESPPRNSERREESGGAGAPVENGISIARIETDEAGMALLLANRYAITERLKALGYLYVTL